MHEALRRIQVIHPNPEGGASSNAELFDNRQQKNSECREQRTWKQSPLDSDHELILNASLTWTDKSFVLVYPTSLIRHKSKYSITFPYLRCNVSECKTIIYYVNDRLVLQSRSNGDTEVGALMFGSLFFILIKYHQCCQVSNAGTNVCVSVCFLIPAESTLNTYCLINNASLYKGLLLFMYYHKEHKYNVAVCHLIFLSVNKLSASQKWI